MFLNHRHRSQRYGDEDDCDPRRYFFNCKKRREDLPVPSSDLKPTRNAPTQRDTSLEMEQDRQWRTSWHNGWNAHGSSSKASPVTAEIVDEPSSVPVDKASVSKLSPRNKNTTQEHAQAKEELLTYDNATLGKQGPVEESTQRARMESEVSIRRGTLSNSSRLILHLGYLFSINRLSHLQRRRSISL